MKPQVYKDPRPAEFFTRFHERTRRRSADFVYQLVRIVLTPYLLLFYRTRCIGSDHVPLEGGAVIAPNHFSFLDHFFVAVYLRRKVYFMAKSQLFTNPILIWIFTHGGVFPVRRGHRDAEAFITAKTVLERGELVVMYCEGGRSRTHELGEAKPGIGRIALETGVPIVPTAIVGSDKARDWRKLQFPKVTVQYGKSLKFEQVAEPTRDQSQAAADTIFEDVKRLHGGIRQGGRRSAIRAAREAQRAARGKAADAAEAAMSPPTQSA